MFLATMALGTLGCISYGFVVSCMSNLLQQSFLLYVPPLFYATHICPCDYHCISASALFVK